jgi:nucleoside permease NupC
MRITLGVVDIAMLFLLAFLLSDNKNRTNCHTVLCT